MYLNQYLNVRKPKVQPDELAHILLIGMQPKNTVKLLRHRINLVEERSPVSRDYLGQKVMPQS